MVEILISRVTSVQRLFQPAAGFHRFGGIVGMDRFPFSPSSKTELMTGLLSVSGGFY